MQRRRDAETARGDWSGEKRCRPEARGTGHADSRLPATLRHSQSGNQHESDTERENVRLNTQKPSVVQVKNGPRQQFHVVPLAAERSQAEARFVHQKQELIDKNYVQNWMMLLKRRRNRVCRLKDSLSCSRNAWSRASVNEPHPSDGPIPGANGASSGCPTGGWMSAPTTQGHGLASGSPSDTGHQKVLE